MNMNIPNAERRFFPALPLALFVSLFLFLNGCENPAGDDGSSEKEEELTVTEDQVFTLKFSVPFEGTRYYTLNTGKEVTDPALIASASWDIAFRNSRLIMTNSGDTAKAVSSGGSGGVWHTNKTDFEKVTGPEARVETDPSGFDYSPYYQDTRLWTWRMGECAERLMNVMSFPGYHNENSADGKTKETALGAAVVNYKYDKKAYYWNPPLPDGGLRMPPDFQPTKQVYIIRHGNGVEYSKFQVSQFVRDATAFSDNYTITWQVYGEEE